MTELQDVAGDLAAEMRDVEALLARVGVEQWALPSPVPGWTVKNQVVHMTAVFARAAHALRAPDGLRAVPLPDATAHLGTPQHDLVRCWRDTVTGAVGALGAAEPARELPWPGAAVTPAVLGRILLLELFAHGQDVADALGARPRASGRLPQLVAFAAGNWDAGYRAHALTPPARGLRFEITGPSGDTWTFGPDDAGQRIRGPARDFCLLVTHHRHRDDVAVVADGPDADAWLTIAQAFRGVPGTDGVPGRTARSAGLIRRNPVAARRPGPLARARE